MLARFLAVWIIALAASPFTQPFSTVTLDWLGGESAPFHSSPLPVRSGSVRNVEATGIATNPPVEVRQALSHSHRHPRHVLPSRPEADDVALRALQDWQSFGDTTQGVAADPMSLFAVLRL